MRLPQLCSTCRGSRHILPRIYCIKSCIVLWSRCGSYANPRFSKNCIMPNYLMNRWGSNTRYAFTLSLSLIWCKYSLALCDFREEWSFSITLIASIVFQIDSIQLHYTTFLRSPLCVYAIDLDVYILYRYVLCVCVCNILHLIEIYSYNFFGFIFSDSILCLIHHSRLFKHFNIRNLKKKKKNSWTFATFKNDNKKNRDYNLYNNYLAKFNVI